MRKFRSFTLLDALFCIGVFIIGGIVLYLAINPTELSKRNNNRQRTRDANLLVYALERQIEEASISAIPFPPNATGSSCVDSMSIQGDGWVKFNRDVVNLDEYFDELPQDPQAPDICYQYRTSEDGKLYQITIQLENDKNGNANRMAETSGNQPYQTLRLGTIKKD